MDQTRGFSTTLVCWLFQLGLGACGQASDDASFTCDNPCTVSGPVCDPGGSGQIGTCTQDPSTGCYSLSGLTDCTVAGQTCAAGENACARTCTNEAVDVVLQPGDDIQAAVSSAAEGTSFRLSAGVYRGVGVVPKANQRFFGELASNCTRLATMVGARLVDTWQQQGGVWVAGGQTQEGQVGGECEAGWRCDRPEDLYFDDQPMHHVLAVSEVGPDSWFFDYDADTVYVGQDPTGHKVELGDARVAFAPSAAGVVVKHLVIEKYAIPSQMGAIGDQYPADGWDVEDNVLQLNHGAGANVGNGSVVRGNLLVHNGQKGIGATGTDVLVESNEIAWNNYAHVAWWWEAGGSKFSYTTNLMVRNNCVHHNYGPGLWTDINNVSVTYEGNVVFSNDGEGIFHEIGYASWIHNNMVGLNGSLPRGWLFSSNILLSTSSDGVVENNYVEVAQGYGNAIGIIWQNRPPWAATNNAVRNNEIRFLGTAGQQGAVADFDPAWSAMWGATSFAGNAYHMPDTSQAYFKWQNSDTTFSGFQSYGEDSGGTVDTDLTARTWSCDLVP